VKRWWFQHVVHDVSAPWYSELVPAAGDRPKTWYCGAHDREQPGHCFLSGLAVARQLGASILLRSGRETLVQLRPTHPASGGTRCRPRGTEVSAPRRFRNRQDAKSAKLAKFGGGLAHP
jgi:hypothetical protein